MLTVREKQENVTLLKGKTRQQGPLSEEHGPTAPRQGGQRRSDDQGQSRVLYSSGRSVGVRKEAGKSAEQLRIGGCTVSCRHVFNIAQA